jgi:hypothetical protein
MKYLLLFLFFFAFTARLSANTIDSLKTDNDILRFVLKIDTHLTYKGAPTVSVVPTDTLLKLLECSDVARKGGVKTWEKLDFNQDGNTDLLVTLKIASYFYVVTVVDKGDNTFKISWLSRRTSNYCEIAWPVKVNDKQMLVFYSKGSIFKGRGTDGKWKWEPDLKMDTLIYLYGDFIEYNPKVKNYAISSISIKSYPTAWPAPEYAANILADGKATFNAKNFDSKNGYFKGAISTNKLEELKSLLDYIQVKKLKDKYQVQWTDDLTVDYEIVFADGTVKRISDYGLIGTFGLRRLYSFLHDLRLSEYWEPVKIPITVPRVELPVNKVH